jgi:hypothetical protein
MKTQADKIICELRKGWHTWGDLLRSGVSQCPWKRLAEAGHKYLRPGEKLQRKVGADGLLRIRVARG